MQDKKPIAAYQQHWQRLTELKILRGDRSIADTVKAVLEQHEKYQAVISMVYGKISTATTDMDMIESRIVKFDSLVWWDDLREELNESLKLLIESGVRLTPCQGDDEVDNNE